MSQLRGVMERTGSKSGSIPFSNPATTAWALPTCHKWPTNKKNPRTKWCMNSLSYKGCQP